MPLNMVYYREYRKGYTSMIPSEIESRALWKTYNLPKQKCVHVQLVCDVALFLADKIQHLHPEIAINIPLLQAACLLHDIDKAIEKLPGERHPEGAVRVLKEHGYTEVADIVKYHSVHFIASEETAPHTIEEKLLFLADKMVKYEVITVDKRFDLWLAEEDLPEKEKEILRSVYPKVKQLEAEIFNSIGIVPQDVAQLLRLTKEEV